MVAAGMANDIVDSWEGSMFDDMEVAMICAVSTARLCERAHAEHTWSRPWQIIVHRSALHP